MSAAQRRAWVALAAGLLMPGLGQVYLGDFALGLCFLVAVALIVPAAALLALWGPPGWLSAVVVVGVGGAIGLYAWSVKAAFRSARREPAGPKQSWQRPIVYVLYTVVGYVFVLAPFTARVRNDLLESFVVPSASMSPGILPGDRVFADKTVGRLGGTRLWRGALAIFVYPNDRTLTFVKRVIGLPGDTVQIDGRSVRVNGKELTLGPAIGVPTADDVVATRELGERGEYAVLWPKFQESDAATAPLSLTVPNGQLFVLGDDRALAVDSRRFGTVAVSDVKGIARQVWLSISREHGLRWNRFGQVLR